MTASVRKCWKVHIYSGPNTYLTDDKEELVQFILRCSDIGYSRTKKDILATVQVICKRKGLMVPVSPGWWDGFQKRHPQLSIHAAEGLGHARSVAFDPVVINRYYDMLESTLKSNDLWDFPGQIFNCDKTRMSLNPGTSKVAAAKGAKHPNQLTSGNKPHITVHCAQVLQDMPTLPWVAYIQGALCWLYVTASTLEKLEEHWSEETDQAQRSSKWRGMAQRMVLQHMQWNDTKWTGTLPQSSRWRWNTLKQLGRSLKICISKMLKPHPTWPMDTR